MGILSFLFGNKKSDNAAAYADERRETLDVKELFQSAVSSFAEGAYDLAEQGFAGVLEIDADHVDSHYYLGRILEERASGEDDFDAVEGAMDRYREVLAGNPNHLDARIRLGMLNIRGGFYEGALRELDEAVRIDPQSPIAHAKLGKAHYAIAIAREVKVEHPTGLGATTDFKGSKEGFKRALDELRRAIKLDNDLEEELSPMMERIGKRVK